MMKISLDWLGDYVTWKESDPLKIAERITTSVAEVDAVEQQGALLTHCCVGKVLSLKKHPDADKLQLCDVKTDKGTKKVVCGGTNVREGMRIAFAHVGATVRWHGTEMMTLEKTKIRGEESEGMICAAEELDLTMQFPDATGHSIIDMGDGDDSVGVSLTKYLGLGDTVLHIDNHAITHRADLFSHVGFARECVALGLATWKKKPEFKAPKFTKEQIPFKMKVAEDSFMPFYNACLISIDSLGQTPDWMKRRLEATGWRSLNLPIDITNYVAMEVGVPLHSFDADDFHGDITMRKAKKGEKITTLDDKERELNEGGLILSDDKGIFDLLGIMGGLRSSTKESTKRVYLHSASLDPVSIRRTMIETGHRTDAGTVYEKGVAGYTAQQGFYRACELFLAHAPGAKLISAVDERGKLSKPHTVSFSLSKVNNMIGADVPAKTVKDILSNLGFDVSGKGDTWKATPPLWRLKDITGEHDLIEEIARAYGYDRIPSVMPMAAIVPPERDERLHRMRDFLKEDGFCELVPLSLLGPRDLQKCNLDPADALEIESPIGEETSLLQTSLLPSLLDHAQKNILHVEDVLRTFTSSHVFSRRNEEHTELGMLFANRNETDLLHDSFLSLKATLTASLNAVGYSCSISIAKTPASFMHPGRSADIIVSGVNIGTIFEVHPAVAARFDLPHRAAVLLLDLDALFAIEPQPVLYRALPEFPAVTYDETIPFGHTQSAEKLLSKLRQSSKLLESVDIENLYSKDTDSDEYQLTLHFIYRAEDRTLTEEEVKKEHTKVSELLTK